MTSKSALYALAVVVLTGSMAVVALADDHGMNVYEPADSSLSSNVGMSEANPGTSEELASEWELRAAMETGAVPDRPESSSDLHSSAPGEEPTVEIGGRSYRPSVDFP